MPAHGFRRDFKAIAGLAVLLVVLITICSGLLFDALLPGLGLASALALGAIISPTDAVAATSVGWRLGLPSRLLTILEGEGLVNDASSLVLLLDPCPETPGYLILIRDRREPRCLCDHQRQGVRLVGGDVPWPVHVDAGPSAVAR
jgi:Sodium/hydrogen exchanger family